MKFCPKCGSVMVPVKKSSTTVLVCRSCGYEEAPDASSAKMYSLKVQIEKKPADKILVLTEKDLAERANLPIVTAHCPKCGNDKAYWWMIQTRSADEPSTRFYRCTKCGYTWREYA